MAGAIGAQLGQLKSEISQLESKREAIKASNEQFNNAIAEIKGRKEMIRGHLDNLYPKLSEINNALGTEGLPDEIKGRLLGQKEQIIEQIALLKNSLGSLDAQISTIQQRKIEAGQAVEAMQSGINMRRNVLQSVAGRMSGAINDYRESGRAKG
ncbi:MAG: hypothetical protein WCJ58_02310 [bacterium]